MTHERSFPWETTVTEPSAGTAQVINTQTPSRENEAADEAKRLAPGLAVVLQLELMSGSREPQSNQKQKATKNRGVTIKQRAAPDEEG